MLFAALFEDAQDVSGIAQVEARERIEERQDAADPGVLRRDRCVIVEPERRAIGAVGLAEAVILQVEAAVIVERRAPEHRAVVHHAVIDVADDLVVAKAAGLFRHAQVAGIDEADELGRFVIEPDARVRRIGRGFPELLVVRQDVRLLFRQAARGIAAVAIGAAEHDVRGLVHRLDAVVALVAADAFRVGLSLGLIDPVLLREGGGLGDGDFRWDGGGRAVAGGWFWGLGEEGRRREEEEEEKETSNVQRPTSNVQRREAVEAHSSLCFFRRCECWRRRS